MQGLWIVITVLLVVANGFFVAAEFALVKVRTSRLEEFVRQGRPFARTAQWLAERLDRALSACQLGITMASLALGWVGEPAIATLIEPILEAMGITSTTVIHTVSFIITFIIITTAHLIIGEQAPKIFAIREPEKMTLWCAVPLKWFYVLSFPLLVILTGATSTLLKAIGLKSTGEHDTPHNEQEIRTMLSHAHAHGELTRSEHELLDAIFEFDDMVCRQIIVPRVDVHFIDVNMTSIDAIHFARAKKHTRYPVCDGSLDQILGFLHVKDLVGCEDIDNIDLRTIIHPPRYVPQSMPISRLLRHFQEIHQHMAFVIDEHGLALGVVTLGNVLERIVGSVQDEFDAEAPDIVPDGPDQFIVQGGTLIDVVNRTLNLNLTSNRADTMGGLAMERLGQLPATGDQTKLNDTVTAEVLETRNSRTKRIRLHVTAKPKD